MNKMMKNIYEHLKTKKKYNTLELNYNVLREEYDKKSAELNMEKRKYLKMKQLWENKLKEQEEEIIELKKRKKTYKKGDKKC